MNTILRSITCIVTSLAFCSCLFAQKKKIALKDSVDGAFDLSDYIIEANGFVPVPYFITEPALGNFGVALIPVFIKKRPPYLDSIKGKWVKTPVAPDVTGGMGLYTLNETWGVAGFRMGTLVKSRIKYRVGGAYMNINMSFFKTFKQLGEKEMKFNFKTVPIFLQAIKRIRFSNWYAGFKYLFLKTDVKYVGEKLLDSLARDLEQNRLVSQLGAIVELDNRDNIFTPDKGVKIHVDAACSDNVLGSDYDFWRLNYYMYAYQPLSKKLIGGLRVDGQQSFGDAPFYMLPYIDMRGIPAVRYQGKADILTEGELRWDFVTRWSTVFFGGLGKAFDDWSEFGSKDWIWSYGIGGRYQLARKFKLRVGIDIAHGPNTWAYYITFGSNWFK
jgi:hypothetical protein